MQVLNFIKQISNYYIFYMFLNFKISALQISWSFDVKVFILYVTVEDELQLFIQYILFKPKLQRIIIDSNFLHVLENQIFVNTTDIQNERYSASDGKHWKTVIFYLCRGLFEKSSYIQRY